MHDFYQKIDDALQRMRISAAAYNSSNPKNEIFKEPDTCDKIVSNTGQYINLRLTAARLLIQYATLIEETGINNIMQKDDMSQDSDDKSVGSAVINNDKVNHARYDAIHKKKAKKHKTKKHPKVIDAHKARKRLKKKIKAYLKMKKRLVKNKAMDLMKKVIRVIVHKDVRTENNTYQCSLCKSNLNTELDVETHKETHFAMFNHMNSSYVKLTREKFNKCDFCTLYFAHKDSLREHRRKYYTKTILSINKPGHDPSKPYHCKVCYWSFNQKSTLEAHQFVHKPAPHACDCGVAFYQAKDLESHRILLSHPKIGKRTRHRDNENNKKESKKTGPSDIKIIKKKTKTTCKPSTCTNKIRSGDDNKINPVLIKPIECRVGGNTIFVERDEKGLFHCTLCDNAFKVPKYFRDHMQLKHGWNFKFMRTCDICGKTLKSSSNMQLHMILHTGERRYPCPICNKRFTQRVVVKSHIKRIHTKERDFACSMCPKKFSEKAKMQYHERTHTGVKPHVCRTCSKRFSDPSAWRRHELIHTGFKPHRCKICPKAFCDPAALFRHKRGHAGYKEQCKFCSRSFASRSCLITHTRMHHSTPRDEDMFECDHCGKRFVTKNYLANHIKNMHVVTPNNKVIKLRIACNICDVLLNPSNMSAHLEKVHLKRYPHKCEDCGKRYFHKNELKKHWQRAHGPEPPQRVQCDICRATYTHKLTLLQHMIFHHLGHKCTTCNKCFQTSRDLETHKRKGCIRCNVCNAAFAFLYKKVEHMAGHHPKQGQPVFECGQCGKTYLTKSRLQSHCKVHKTAAASYKCHECDAKFPRKKDIVEHIWGEHMLWHHCDRCQKRFFSIYDLRRHKASCESEICDICNKTVTRRCGLRDHRAMHEPSKYLPVSLLRQKI